MVKQKSGEVKTVQDGKRIRSGPTERENYRKHTDRDKDEFEKNANERLITGLLQTVDDLKRSIGEIKDDKARRGISMIYDNLMHILGGFGLKRIDALGKMFDHYYHEAVLSGKSGKEDGTIIAELVPGYMLNSKVIRHSKVKIAKR